MPTGSPSGSPGPKAANFAARLIGKLTKPAGGWANLGDTRRPSSPPRPPAAAAAPPPQGDDANLAGNLTTLGNSFIAFVGAGILDLPYAFSKVGLQMGTLVMVAVAVMCLHCMFILVDCKLLIEKNGKACNTYGDVGREALGPAGATLVDVSLVITQFGFCTAYLILISHNLDSVLADSPGFIPYIWLCVPGQMMLATLRHLKFLGKFSLVADVTMAFALGTVFFYCKQEMDRQAAEGIEVKRLQGDMSMTPYFFGVCIYCYEGIGMVIPIQAAMRNKHQFKAVWGLNMVCVTLLFWSVGYIGYTAYGVSVHESIASNLPAFDYLQVMVQLALCLGLYFTFPVMMFPVYQILEGGSAKGYQGNEELKSKAIRWGVVVMSAFVASAVPSFSSFVVLVGSSTCALLALIFPAIFSLKLRDSSPLAMAREGSVVVLGIIAAFLGTEDALKRMAAA